MKAVGAFLFVALFVGAGIRTNDAANARQRFAEGWSSDSAQFVAVGLTGSTLHAALPVATQVECDAYVDYVLVDREVVLQLKAAGFQRVSCGQRTGDLR